MQIENIKKVENIFIYFALIFGLFLIFMTPPFQSPDEPAHFAKAFSFAQGHFLSQKVNGIAGDYLPEAIIDFQNRYDPLFFNTNLRVSLSEIEQSKKILLDENKKIFVNQKYHAMYSPVAYAPQGTGVWIGKHITKSVYWIMITGKIFLLLFYILCGFWAIKSLPFGKWLCFLILLMPMSLSLGASLSADGILISVSVLFASKVFQYAFQDKELRDRQLFSLCIFAILLALIKQSFLISLFVLFIPIKKYGKYGWLKIAGILLPAFIVSLLWSKYSYSLFVPMNNSNPEIQVHFIFEHPFVYAATLFKTLKAYFLPLIYSSIGVLGWLDVFLFPFMYWLYLCFLIANCFLKDKKEDKLLPANLWQKIFVPLYSILNFVVICTIIYVSWAVPYLISPFEGLQGRYFIPLLLPVLCMIYLLCNEKSEKKLPDWFKALNCIFLVLVYLNIGFGLFIRYYATF